MTLGETLEELEERVERIEQSLDIEGDYYDGRVYAADKWWDAKTFAIYNHQDAFGEDHDGYVLAADEVDGHTWNVENRPECDETVVVEEQAWAVDDVDDELLDEYLVTWKEPDWRETFEDVFSYNGFEVIEVGNNPAVIEHEDYVPIGCLNEIRDNGWQVRCIHGPDHHSAHPKVQDTDGMVIRFENND